MMNSIDIFLEADHIENKGATMEICVPRESGFCPGVKRADQKIRDLAEHHQDKKIYILGALINNQNYLTKLSEQNIMTVGRIEDIPQGEWAVIRSHGLAKSLQQKLMERGPVLDLTCPKVKAVQGEIEKWASKAYFLVLNGKNGHPETLGLLSYNQNHILITPDSDDQNLYHHLEEIAASKKHKGLFFTSQTTGHSPTFNRLTGFADQIGTHHNTQVYHSICPVIAQKEKSALILQQDCELSLVIGDRSSSNASRLFQRLSQEQKNCYFVTDIEDLKKQAIDFSSVSKAMVVSSASTPLYIEKEIINYLENL
ncbi:MAG: hypothetical protein JXR70_06180 [Spirochaetales bacterium]|nr:hypothetical protein [Spirochaetales bacterium]